jgi:hypothetical protein
VDSSVTVGWTFANAKRLGSGMAAGDDMAGVGSWLGALETDGS